MIKTIKEEIKPVEVEKKITRFEDIDSSLFVNEVKAKRAFKAVYGGAKPDTAEMTLASKLRGEFKGEELVTEIYKGLGGLVDFSRAKQNRANEAKDRVKKALR